jgi:hypothetical protein
MINKILIDKFVFGDEENLLMKEFLFNFALSVSIKYFQLIIVKRKLSS